MSYLIRVKAAVYEVSVSMDCPSCGRTHALSTRTESPLRWHFDCCGDSYHFEQEIDSEEEVISDSPIPPRL